MLDLGIITLSRTTEYVERLLDSLADAMDLVDARARHIVVNNSNDPKLTAAGIKRRALVMEPGYNTTFSVGNNLAARALPDAEWLLLLNDDLVPELTFMQQLWARREDCDVLGALLVQSNGLVNHAGTYIRPLMTDHLGRNKPREEWGQPAAVPCAAVTFAAALVKHTTWDELGGLDEAYSYGWEDTDFCMRVLEAGGTIKCARDAVALHDECGTRPRGGMMDNANYRTFTDRWKDRTMRLLTEYQQRVGRLEGY